MKRRHDPDVRRAIEESLVLGYSPKRTLDRLAAAPDLRDRLPSLRTVTDMNRRLRPPDTADTWTVAKASPDEAALVLPVLRAVLDAGQLTSFTLQTGRWVARVRRMAPGLSVTDTLIFAARYAGHDGDETTAIDVDLAVAMGRPR